MAGVDCLFFINKILLEYSIRLCIVYSCFHGIASSSCNRNCMTRRPGTFTIRPLQKDFANSRSLAIPIFYKGGSQDSERLNIY